MHVHRVRKSNAGATIDGISKRRVRPQQVFYYVHRKPVLGLRYLELSSLLGLPGGYHKVVIVFSFEIGLIFLTVHIRGILGRILVSMKPGCQAYSVRMVLTSLI